MEPSIHFVLSASCISNEFSDDVENNKTIISKFVEQQKYVECEIENKLDGWFIAKFKYKDKSPFTSGEFCPIEYVESRDTKIQLICYKFKKGVLILITYGCSKIYEKFKIKKKITCEDLDFKENKRNFENLRYSLDFVFNCVDNEIDDHLKYVTERFASKKILIPMKINPTLNINLISCLDKFETKNKLRTKRLEPYNKTKDVEICRNNSTKKSETAYNKRIYENNLHKFSLFDCLTHETKGLEICDLYDRENNILFCNKKDGDYRILSQQGLLAAYYLSQDDFGSKEFRDKHGISTNKLTFCFGLICMKKKSNKYIEEDATNFKDKITLGSAMLIIESFGFDTEICYVDVIEN